MHKSQLIFILFFLFLFDVTFAQTVEVRDKLSQKPINEAVIYKKSDPGQVIIIDGNGKVDLSSFSDSELLNNL